MMRMRGMMVTMTGRAQLDEHFGREYDKYDIALVIRIALAIALVLVIRIALASNLQLSGIRDQNLFSEGFL